MDLIAPFEIPLWAELGAVGLGALQGALFAGGFTERRIDVLGVVLVGIGVALGGSLLRDVLLGEPPVVIYGSWYVLVAALTALLGLLLQRLFVRLDPLIVALDAVTIGLFGAIGASKALALGVPVVPAVFVGAAAAVGGSVLRDVTLNLPVALLHVGSLYAIAAAAGAALLVGLVAAGVPVLPAAVACVVLTTVLRLLAVRFNWSVPEHRAMVLRRRRGTP
ncbi:trimeric intracellular cation channel family protein [Promicromonospora thailandica]|uniref:Membrane protein YeiH n=1 Tax=Promicromonospora thailandica TaxID=765201 RepID=A0A9X2G4T7_9MICO|nr:TRIC cation channel family protein [Promicromonospora thailandica]MCP2263289.1 putative membrane protein YeiH [Promicromonospora thailandica]BFF18689.1 trimeric intracellular cation channel family protein [Promicromonospora thailandica]